MHSSAHTVCSFLREFVDTTWLCRAPSHVPIGSAGVPLALYVDFTEYAALQTECADSALECI